MSKMGICTISSYRGSELFEIIGLNSEIINNVFKFSNRIQLKIQCSKVHFETGHLILLEA